MGVTDKVKSSGTIIVTVAIFVFVGAWSLAVWSRLGTPPTYLADGKTVKVDEFSRAKDLLVLVFPLLTTAVGYWLGSQGTAKAEEKAKQAEARKEAVIAEAQPGVLLAAIEKYPKAFE